MITILNSECCPNSALTKTRHISPSLAVSRRNIFLEPLHTLAEKKQAILFKCSMQRGGGKRDYNVKVGIAGSDSRILQTLQGVSSAVTPGNISSFRSPVRSRVASAITPGGGRNIPGGFGALKPERGYRCPEGYQYGGRFTDSRFSTCGKQLFDLPGIIGRAIASALRGPESLSRFQEIRNRRISSLSVSGEIIQSRAPQIPKVTTPNRPRRLQEIDDVVQKMSDVNDSYTRMVRRDGFVLEPVVSPAVLRTIPDNRDMEGASFIMNALTEESIGNDELGMLSNSGIESLTYVLSGGSTLSLSKSRNLTVGERRKLGRTIAVAEKMKNTEDPAQKLKYIASEMGDSIEYAEDFKNLKNANELITVKLPGGSGKRTMRRWHYESFYRKKKKSNRVSRATQLDVLPEDEKISDLSSAVRHLNNGGSIQNISATIRSEAINRSAIYKTNKIRNGIMIHERADGQTVFEITPEKQFEHLGAAFASELQRSMGLVAPKVRLSGAGKKRNYMLGEAQDAEEMSRQERLTDIASLPPEDILGITIADFLTDTIERNPSTITPVRVGGRMRAVSSLNLNAGLAGMSASEIKNRRNINLNQFFNKQQILTYQQYFKKLREQQRRKTLILFEKLMEQASDFDFRKFKKNLLNDGELSEAEKVHLDIMEKIFEQRVNTIRTSSVSFKKIIGLAD